MIKLEEKYEFIKSFLIGISNNDKLIYPDYYLILELLIIREFLKKNMNKKIYILISIPSLFKSFSESINDLNDGKKEILTNFSTKKKYDYSIIISSIGALYNFEDDNYNKFIMQNINNLNFIESDSIINFTSRKKIIDKYVDGIEFNKWFLSIKSISKNIKITKSSLIFPF